MGPTATISRPVLSAARCPAAVPAASAGRWPSAAPGEPAGVSSARPHADRIALDLGYGPALAEVFTGREYQRAHDWQAAPRQSLKDSQPLDSARLRALERLLASTPQNGHQPPY